MKKRCKDARPTVGAVKRAAEPGTNSCESPDPICILPRAAAVRQTKISGFLLAGAENAIPRCHLRQLTGLSDRDLRRQIQDERLSGSPILSSTTTGGYYLPSSETELEHFVRSMQSRAKEIEAVAAAVEKGNGGLSEQTPYTVPEETL